MVGLNFEPSKNVDLLHAQRRGFALRHFVGELQELLGGINVLMSLVVQLAQSEKST